MTLDLKPVRTVAPAADLVSLAQAKKHCRVDHDDDDTLIADLIASATAYLDGYSGILGVALVNQTWRQNVGSWPDYRISLAPSPVSEITSVKYYDADNVQQTLSTSNYSLVEDASGPSIEWADGVSLPALFARPDAIEVLFVAGYGAAASAVPAAIRHVALMLVGTGYENRESMIIGDTAEELPFVRSLISAFRRVTV